MDGKRFGSQTDQPATGDLMDVEKLQELAKTYPEVQELLRDNYNLSVAILTKRLNTFDANHTKAEASLADRLKVVETTLERAAAFSIEVKKRLTKLETEIKEALVTRQDASSEATARMAPTTDG